MIWVTKNCCRIYYKNRHNKTIFVFDQLIDKGAVTKTEKIVFVGRLLPVVRTYVSLPAGIGRTNFFTFVVYTFAGSLIWNTILTYAGSQLGHTYFAIGQLVYEALDEKQKLAFEILNVGTDGLNSDNAKAG